MHGHNNAKTNRKSIRAMVNGEKTGYGFEGPIGRKQILQRE